jgi:hypothetical protein
MSCLTAPNKNVKFKSRIYRPANRTESTRYKQSALTVELSKSKFPLQSVRPQSFLILNEAEYFSEAGQFPELTSVLKFAVMLTVISVCFWRICCFVLILTPPPTAHPTPERPPKRHHSLPTRHSSFTRSKRVSHSRRISVV